MRYKILLSGKNVSKCHLQKFLPSMVSVKMSQDLEYLKYFFFHPTNDERPGMPAWLWLHLLHTAGKGQLCHYTGSEGLDEPSMHSDQGFCCLPTVIESHRIYCQKEKYMIRLYWYEGHSSDKELFQLKPASVAQLDAPSDWRPGGSGFNPRRGRQHSFVEIDHEIFSTIILSLPLIQEGQLSVSGERMCTILVNRLED